MDKKELREYGIATLKQLHPNQKKAKERKIHSLLFSSQNWIEAKNIGVIRSLPFEFDTTPIFEKAYQLNKNVAVPKVENKELYFYQVDENTSYTLSTFGVEEPNSQLLIDELDLVIVPGLVFSSKGYRIGFGGGFYDRFLSTFKGATISLVFSQQLRDDWQPEVFDRPVSKIITDSL